jgi:2-dehydro-3-deoxyphosphogluconate aldolase / (4S)-4-hydroxy-2-oxoglutarate aldolase
MNIDQIMRTAPVIPVLVLDGDEDWAELAETFVGAGLPVLEVTLRTPGALDAIRRMSEVPGAIVGAGTVLNEKQLGEAVHAGAQFIVSPGLTEALARAVMASDLAFLPGVATAGDIMRGLDLGIDHFKFFPAEAAGGVTALKALSGPFGQVRFCPTGGVRPTNAREWLALETVLCVGGSWLYGSDVRMDEVNELARTAAALRRP